MRSLNASFPTVGILDHEAFDLVLQGADLVLELAGFVRGDRGTGIGLVCSQDCKEAWSGLTQSPTG